MSSGPPARLRATHTQGTVHTLQALDPGRLPAVLARLDPAVRRGILEAPASDRIPAEWDVALVRAELEVLGRDGMRRVARAALVDALGGPQLGALLTAALRLFGATPAGLYRWAGRAWSHIMEGCGELRLDRVEGQEAWLLLEGMPAELAEPDYLEAVAAALESVLDVCRVEGDASVVPRPDGGRFHVRWRAAPARR
jgi:hypothetical protein